MEALQYEFVQNALIAGALVSIATGVIGTLIALNRLVFLSGGVAHAAYGGIGLAYYLGLHPLGGAFCFSVAVALAMGYVEQRWRDNADTIIGMLWAAGMGIGILFLDLTPGYKVDLMSYLFGNILMVGRSDIWLMIALNASILLFVLLFYKELVAISFDPSFARTRDIPVTWIYMLFLVMIACSVVILIRAVGLILVIALLTAPVAIARRYVLHIKQLMLVATLLGATFVLAGLFVSYLLDVSSGASIILIAVGTYLCTGLAASLKKGRGSSPPSNDVEQDRG